ncbi:MAG: flagellar biosynthesis protein FlhB [Azospirillum sp.]|nr:flagellar biosynthesis protein FlhB [Azospirillum sp.]
MSEEQDESSKTEEPTSKRLSKAHEQGQFAISREINNWLSIATTLAIFAWFLPDILSNLQMSLGFYISESYQISMDPGNTRIVFIRALMNFLSAVWLPVLLLMVAGILGSVVQTGFNVSWEPLKPKLSKISPMTGIKRIFSISHQGVETAKSLAKLAVIGVVAYVALQPMMNSIEHFTGIDPESMLSELERVAVNLIAGVLAVLTLIAAGDLAWQRYDFHKKMKMTKQEVKEEHKQQEGDPIVKGRIRQLRMEKARRRMMASVPQADVVVTNPSHFAVAMKYDPATMNAPRVLAKGADQVAFNIRKLANDHGIPIVENPPLARALYASVELDQEIPAEHYRAVAEIISYVFGLKKRPSGR